MQQLIGHSRFHSRRVRPLAWLVLALFLLTAVMSPALAWAEGEKSGSLVFNALPITLDSPVKDQLPSAEESRWFRFEPSCDTLERDTHLVIELTREFPAQLKVYPNFKSAAMEHTSFSTQESKIEVPLAYTGPYYVQVTGIVLESESAKASTTDPVTSGPFELRLTTASYPPQTFPMGVAPQKASPAEVVVKFKGDPPASLHRALAPYGMKEVRSLKLPGRSGIADGGVLSKSALIKLAPGADALAVARELAALPDVEYAEPNYAIHPTSRDVYYPYQWSLENTGQNGGVAGADINWKGMEKILKGKKFQKTRVAVVDMGIEPQLADFEGRVSDLGIDIVNGDDDPYDEVGHGTVVAGIMAATGGNGHTLTGVNPFCEILPIKVMSKDGGKTVYLAQAIIYATVMKAKVINLSLEADGYSQVVEDALQFAEANGVLCVAATGNAGKDTISYPASSKYALAVGASNAKDEPADFSNYGEGLDVLAPGDDIAGVLPDGRAFYLKGTSLAAPQVSGIAGLLYSLHPKLTPAQAAQMIRQGCQDLGEPGYDTKTGYGRVDGAKILKSAPPALPKDDAVIVKNTIPGRMAPGQESVVAVTVRNTGNTIWNDKALYSLRAFGDGELFYPGLRVDLKPGEAVQPGQLVTFELTLKAPAETLRYLTHWRMEKDGQPFGAALSKVIHVTGKKAK